MTKKSALTIILLILFAGSVAGALIGVAIELPLDASSIRSAGGVGYEAPLPRQRYLIFWLASDTNLAPFQSGAQLYEDGRALGPAHAPLATITATGGGRFLHRRQSLHFSGSDNTDPRHNGRHYRFEDRAKLPTLIPVILLGLILSVRRADLRRLANWLDRLAERLEPHRGGRLVRICLISGIPALVVGGLLQTPIPASILAWSFHGVYELLLPVGLLLYWSFRQPGTIGRAAGLSLVLALFCLPLFALWQNIGYHAATTGGLLPWSDAAGYYAEAQLLIEGTPLDWTARRPLYTGALASLLALTGGNLPATLLIFALINGAAGWIFAQALAATEGPLAATLGLLLVFIFYRVEGGSGTTLTENLGLPLGLLSLAILLHATRRHDAGHFAIGLGLLTLALCARAGAFFVLPTMLIAGRLIFRHFRLSSILAVGTAFLVNAILARLITRPNTAAFSNFSLTLYGLVTGGKGWRQIRLDHPHATEGSEMYRYCWEYFVAHPLDLPKGLALSVIDHLPPASGHIFSFIQLDHKALAWPLYLLCFGALLAGIVQSIRHYRSDRLAVLILCAVAGGALSVPFLPPGDGGLRVYAATLGLLILPVVRPFRQSVASYRQPPAVPWTPSLGASALIILATIVPVWLRHHGTRPPSASAACAPETTPLIIRYHPRSALPISNRPPAGAGLDQIASSSSRLEYYLAQSEAGLSFRELPVDTVLVDGRDLANNSFFRLTIPNQLRPSHPGILKICAVHRGLTPRDPVFHALSALPN